MVDDKTGGEFSEQVDQGQDMAKDFVDDLPED
jgi:MT0933-like antitoxin protein